MALRDKVLNVLEEKKGEPVSGESLAELLGVSRTAVWKAVTSLKKEGYPIDAKTNKGYSLSSESDKLSEVAIRACLSKLSPYEKYLKEESDNNLLNSIDCIGNIIILDTVDSTNNEAKRLVASAASLEDIPFGTVIIAENQSAGKGRRGRSFYSPVANSVYMSFILKPTATIENSLLITIAAGVAVCRAIEATCDDTQRPEIKWVNDIFVNKKKICGILTEAISDIESGEIESLVLGIGVNINIPEEDFPKELRDIAGSVKIAPGKRNQFAATLSSEVFSIYYAMAEGKEIIPEYRARSMMEGREIIVVKGKNEEKATALSVSDNGGLSVEYPDGRREILRSGEVSIKI